MRQIKLGSTTILALLLFTNISVSSISQPLEASSSSQTILAIFAHPDDDVAIGPLLAHYAKQRVKVYLAIVTSGQQGTNSYAKIPAGDELGAVRENEAKTACQAYGVTELFLLGEQDGSLSSMKRHSEIRNRLLEIIRQVRPSVIITWGPDGLTGHPDHRAVSNLVSEVFQMWDARETRGFIPQKLYYVAYPKSETALTHFLNIDDSLITTIVNVRDGLDAAAKAEAAYKSQHTPNDMKFWNELMANTLKGNMYLRLALSRTRKLMDVESDLFDGLNEK